MHCQLPAEFSLLSMRKPTHLPRTVKVLITYLYTFVEDSLDGLHCLVCRNDHDHDVTFLMHSSPVLNNSRWIGLVGGVDGGQVHDEVHETHNFSGSHPRDGRLSVVLWSIGEIRDRVEFFWPKLVANQFPNVLFSN